MVEKGIYPQQIGLKGMNRVNVRDIAEEAVRNWQALPLSSPGGRD
jgi:hypothetical protein